MGGRNPSKVPWRRSGYALYCGALDGMRGVRVTQEPTQTLEQPAQRQRLHRSELAVPGSNVRMLDRAPGLGADIVMLDLEDAVAPDDKAQARVNIIDALLELDWSGCSVSLRINGLDTHWCYRDLVDVVEEAGHELDQIMIPKVSGAGDVHLVATLLDQIEEAVG